MQIHSDHVHGIRVQCGGHRWLPDHRLTKGTADCDAHEQFRAVQRKVSDIDSTDNDVLHRDRRRAGGDASGGDYADGRNRARRVDDIPRLGSII